MIIVEVKTSTGQVLEHRTFSVYSVALAWFERAKEVYEHGISITFGGEGNVVLR
jgi:hypothetical protein